ncbi:regulator of G-protein signaling 14a isoform X1 [Electrophorus electricus]|uniref:Regulator of G protein signaling 14a n=1 Tax=Electrophorus electricus TaxID=8005 RepID=A0A4W4FRI7_ELEEL|nr:regulator of G-protein signaling 14a isoform X1 [Electrophorus electricus]
MSNKMKTLAVPTCHLTQAVSDGELNMSRLSSTGSSPSLSGGSAGGGGPRGADDPASRVVSWAVCFERLLEDPVGVRYFTAFLKSEVSAENILFWQACEKFRKIPPANMDELKKEAHTIYDLYLSDASFHSVNIDDTARVSEHDLENPTADMFSKAQQQIFKLMKFDSYTRFVRSQLYQNCMLASVEGRPLPDHTPHNKGSRELGAPTANRKSTDVKMLLSDSKVNKKTKVEKRGSWGADASYGRVMVSRQVSQISVKSNSSMELGLLSGRLENDSSSSLAGSDPDVAGVSRAEKYCCVYLPDGTASLAPARSGLLLRDMLSSLCEKRGFPLKDVIIYLHDKDKPLSLDQDSSVLQDQQVLLEVRVTFMLQVMFTGKTVGIIAKSSKTLGEALSSVLQKNQLRSQDALITLSGSNEPLSLNTSVFSLANKTLCLDKNGGEMKAVPAMDRGRTSTRPKKAYDMDGLVEMLSRAQCSRVDDQRGLLTKEQLEMPLFLQLPAGGREGDPGDLEVSSPKCTCPANVGVDQKILGIKGDDKDSNKKKGCEDGHARSDKETLL